MEIGAAHVWKTYGQTEVLRDVSFTAGARPVCLTAPSGAGKTTLLRILLGLESPDRGEVLAPPGTRWSAVFQEDRLLEHLDARGNLRFVLGEVSPEALTLLETLGLGDVGGKIVAEYSGGMRRRLALARALLSPCDALVLDEPFTGLDPEIRARCWEQVRRYTAGKPLVLSSHDPADARALEAEIFQL